MGALADPGFWKMGRSALNAAGSGGIFSKILTNAVQGGKEFVEGIIQRGIPVRAGPKVRGFGERPKVDLVKKKHQSHYYARSEQSPLTNYLTTCGRQGLASEVGRKAARQLWSRALRDNGSRLRYLSKRLAAYGFVGVSLAGGGTYLTEDVDPTPMCKHISELFCAVDVNNYEFPTPLGKYVEDYQFGRLIATGCDAAVYEASPCPKASPGILPKARETLGTPSEASLDTDASFEILSESDDSFEMMSETDVSFEIISDSEDSAQGVVMNTTDSTWSERLSTNLVTESSLGIKVMFNYGIESNALALEEAMVRELVPVPLTVSEDNDHLCGSNVKKKKSKMKSRLPPHPNIAEMYGYFVDKLPLLDAAHCMYPMALPPRLHAEGYGRNSTMFIVMKKYSCSLSDYLHQHGPFGARDGALLLLQLVNAIQHMQQNNIAHRDLKSDNLLLCVSPATPPLLVVSDFGHCLDGDPAMWGLRLPYVSSCMEKGGNAKLMAPEVSAAFPGRDSWLDFRCSDLWAAGTLAYEIFAGANPFYTDLFDSRNYHESELPVLPNTVPPVIKNVIHGMLQKEPRKRPSSAVISHLLSLWLWAPVAWQQQVPDNITIKRWIVQFTARQILRKLSADDVEWQQKALFLRNLKWCHLEAALEMLIPTAQA